jgi:hypothetical protein
MVPSAARTSTTNTSVQFLGPLDDLRVPPGNRLEALYGDREGQNSIRINDQWRICFVWRDGESWDVEIVDWTGSRHLVISAGSEHTGSALEHSPGGGTSRSWTGARCRWKRLCRHIRLGN